jgi:hypothetical protein
MDAITVTEMDDMTKQKPLSGEEKDATIWWKWWPYEVQLIWSLPNWEKSPQFSVQGW